MEVASSKYLYGLPDGEVPLAFNFNGTVHYRGDDGRLQMSLDPVVVLGGVPAPGGDLARADRALLPAHRLDRAARGDARALQREKARRALPTLDACVAELLERRAVSELVDSLLYEGYALYPYTPGATKNATPTPFGIVYPPAYARDAREHLRPPRAPLRRRGRRRGRAPRCASWRPAASATRREPQRIEGEGDFERRRPVGADRGWRSSRSSGGRAAGLLPRREPHRGPGRARARRGASLLADLDPPGPERHGRALRLAARRPMRQRQHLAGARLARRTT